MATSVIASSFVKAAQQDVLDDLSSRFILNVPDEELASVERILFQVEQAFWFYEDFVRPQQPNLQRFTLKTFSAQLFRHCPLLRQWQHEHEQAFDDFMQYKNRVPVCGAILLNSSMEKVLLVRGWSAKAGWGFPKGKINKDEDDEACAIREVYEETGFDVTTLIDSAQFLEATIKEQRIKLFIVVGVPEDYDFEAQTRQEIGKIEWHPVKNLPQPGRGGDRSPAFGYASAGGYTSAGGVSTQMGKSYSIMPFVPRLKTWIQRQKKLKRRDVRRYSKDRLAPQLDDYSSSDGSESDVEDEQPRSSKRKKASKGTQSASIPPTPAAPQTVTTEVPTTTTHTAGNLPAIPEPSLVAASSSSSATDALKALLGVGMSLPAESDLLPLPLAHIGQTGALTDQSNDIMRLLHNAAKSPRLAQSDLGIVSVAIAPSKIEAPGPPGHLREETTSRTSDLLTLLKGTGGKTVPEHSAVETLKLPRVDGAVDVMESLVPGLAKKKELPKSITTPPRMLVTITPSEVPADILSSVQYVPLKGVGGEEGTDNVSGRPETPQLEGSEARTPPRRPSTTVPVTPTTPWLPPRPHAPIPPTPTSPAVFLFSEQQLKGPDFGDTSIPATLGAPGAAQPSLLDLLRNGTDKGQEIPSQSMPFNAEVPVMDSSALLNFSLDINDLLKQL